jgi:outer membrane protein assembly factor BamB
MTGRARPRAALLVCGAILIGAPPARAWQAYVDEVLSSNGQAREIGVDPEGNVLAVGFVREFTAAKLALDSGAELWRATITGSGTVPGQPRGVAAASNGDAIVAGSVSNAGTAEDFFVARLAAHDGSERWRTALNGSAGTGEEAFDVAVDGSGDVIAAGRLDNVATHWDFAVAKLAGDDGEVRWRYELDGAAHLSEEARVAAVDSAGDVVAAGFVRDGPLGSAMAIVKLSGASGSELWRSLLGGGDEGVSQALALAIAPDGDVIVGGHLAQGATLGDFAVLKLDGDDGATLWSRVLDGGASGEDEAASIALGAGGEIYAAGRLTGSARGADLAIVALDGSSGAPLWTYRLDGGVNGFDEARDVSIGAGGDPVAVGVVEGRASKRDLVAVRVDRASGSELWRQVVDGSADDLDEGISVAALIAAPEAVIAGGEVWRASRRRDFEKRRASREFSVLRLEGDDGTLLRHVSGLRFSLVDHPSSSRSRRLKLYSRDSLALLAPVRGSPSDPRTEGAGGSGAGGALRLRNPITGEAVALPLPAANWRALGSDARPRGYRYRDRNGSSGACRHVVLRTGRRLRARCAGAGIQFTLNEAEQVRLAAMLVLGEAPVGYCLEFGGEIRADFPVDGAAGKGKFAARDAPAPLRCAAHGG